jgi:hypothetical protein
MQPDERILWNNALYNLDTRLGQGQLGAVYSLVGKPGWVAKIALDDPSAEQSLREEFETLSKLGECYGPRDPAVVRAQAASEESSRRFVLMLENVPEENQLAIWLQDQLARSEIFKAEEEIWQLVLDYIEVIQFAHNVLRRSVTDRKVADFRWLPSKDRDTKRLIVLDWNVLAARMDVVQDIRLLGQLWYALITMRNINAEDVRELHLLSEWWGKRLTIGSRHLLRQCLTGGFTRLQELQSAVKAWRSTLQRQDMAEWQARGSRLPANFTEAEMIESLTYLDLLRRADPQRWSAAWEERTKQYYSTVLSTIELLGRQAQRVPDEAQRKLDELRQDWKTQWPSLRPALDQLQNLLRSQEDAGLERSALDSQLSAIRGTFSETANTLSRIYLQSNIQAVNIAELEQAHESLDRTIGQLQNTSAQKTARNLSKQRSAVKVLLALLRSEQSLALPERGVQAAADILEGASLAADLSNLENTGLDELVRLIRDRQSRLAKVLNTDGTLGVKQIEREMLLGNFDTAIRLYQSDSMTPFISPLRRLSTWRIIEPAYLIQELREAADDLSLYDWMALLNQVYNYLLRAGRIHPTISKHWIAALDKPYQAFERYSKDPSASTLALGEMLNLIYQLCKS